MRKSKTLSEILDFSVVAFFVFILMMMLLWGCKHDPVLPVTNPESTAGNGNGGGNGGSSGFECDPDSTYFQNEVLPLFVSNCAKSGCHDATTHEEGFIFNSFAGIMNSGEIEAGDPSEGDIMEVITENDPDKVMPPPPNDPLTAAQINIISNWISQGAQNNACAGDCDTTTVTYAGTILPLLQSKCIGCHNNNTTSGNVNLSTHTGAQTQALNGRLLAVVNHEQGFSPMPKGGNKLPPCEIAELRIWVEDGAPNN